MIDIERKVADEICFGDLSMDPTKWLDEEVKDLASHISGLDEIPLSAIRPLAKLSANGALDEHDLVRATGLDLPTIDNCLDALDEHKFVKQCSGGYEATDKGKEAFRAVGSRLVVRKRSEMKAKVEALTALYQDIDAMWPAKPYSPIWGVRS